MRTLLWQSIFILGLAGPAFAAPCDFSESPERQRVSQALNSRDHGEIARVIAEMNPAQIAPDIPAARGRDVGDLGDAPILSAAQRNRLVGAQLRAARVTVQRITDPRATPEDLPFALRHVAGIVRGSVALAQTYPDRRADALDIAETAADFLVDASREAGVPFTPFPYWRGQSGRLGELSETMARGLEACDGLETRVRKGWFIVPEVPEQYFFDTGVVGAALAELMTVRPKETYRNWLEAATLWFDAQNLSSNFNYNAFPAEMFASRHAQRGDPKDLERALDWLRFGVVPGMISEGPDAGHWIDPHNNLLTYRVIMVHAMLSTRRQMVSAGSDPDPRLETAIEQSFAAIEEDVRDGRIVESAERMIDIYRALDALAAQGIPVIFDGTMRTAIEAIATRWLLRNGPRGDLATALFLAMISDETAR